MEPVVGIDLGTTNSVVAIVEEGKVRVLADREGRTLQPSQVSFMASGEIAVGYAARDRRLMDAKNTIYSVKRLIGRDFDSPEVKRAIERFPFEIREGPNRSPIVVARGQTYTLPEISALVLKHMKAVAEAARGRPIRRAVITVPANFNDVQRSTTKVAGRIAGLEILRIVNEPTAAALAYGYGRGKSERVAIYDFGGGTFDITILQLRDHIFEVLATAGDTFLGGDDIDDRLAEQFAEAFLRIHRYDLKADRVSFERLRAAAEQVKIQLSVRQTVSVRIEELAYGDGGQPLDLQLSVSRETLETRIRDIVEKTFEVCQDGLKLAGLSVSDLDNVILVGGSTRIPLVRQRVAEFFGRQPLAEINPDEVVAVGAAIQGFALAADGERQKRETGRTTGPQAPVPQPPALTPRPAAPTGAPARPPTSPLSRTAPMPAVDGPQTGAPPQAEPQTAELPALKKKAPAPLPKTLPTLPQRPSDPRSTDFASLLADENDIGSGVSPIPPPPTAPQSFPLERAATSSWQDSLLEDDEPTLAPGRRAPAGPTLRDPPKIVAPGPLPTAEPITLETRAEAPRAKPPVAPKTGHPPSPAPPPLPSVPPPLPPPRPVQPTPPLPAPRTAQPTPLRGAWTPGSEPISSSGISVESVVPGQIKPDMSKVPSLAPPGEEFPEPSMLRPAPGLPDAALLTPLPDPSMPRMPLQAPHPGQVPAPRMVPPPGRALLLDVTPQTLGVQTVQGFCDHIIARNAAIPVEQTRIFSTTHDMQDAVVIRICQGESRRVEKNVVLGELELQGIRPAPRGEVQIAVTFEIDTDGILNVSAKDLETGRAQRTQITLFGGYSEDQIREMTERSKSLSVA